MSITKLDPGGVLKDVHDPVTGTLKVNLGSSTLIIDASTDSISVYGSDGITKQILKIDSTGRLKIIDETKLVPKEHDQITVATSNSNGDPTTINYKLLGSTISTLTLTYDSNGNFLDVVRS